MKTLPTSLNAGGEVTVEPFVCLFVCSKPLCDRRCLVASAFSIFSLTKKPFLLLVNPPYPPRPFYLSFISSGLVLFSVDFVVLPTDFFILI
jgi:hypothetical protein